MANAIRRAARAVRMRFVMVRFLSYSGECFDGYILRESGVAGIGENPIVGLVSTLQSCPIEEVGDTNDA
jgi:hypothetical protein